MAFVKLEQEIFYRLNVFTADYEKSETFCNKIVDSYAFQENFKCFQEDLMDS